MSMDSPWPLYGLFMGSQLTVHRLSMDSPWSVHGLSMDCPFTVHGQYMDCPTREVSRCVASRADRSRDLRRALHFADAMREVLPP